MDSGAIVVVLGAVLLASLARGLTGFGFALVAMPFFVLVMDVQDAVVASSLLGTLGVALLAASVWRDVPWRMVAWLLAGSFAGMPVGLAVLVFAPEDALRLGVSLLVIVMAAALVLGLRLESGGPATELFVGATSGVLKTSTSISGPPVVIYLQGRRAAPEKFRAALVMFFLVGYVISVAAYFGTGVVTGDALITAGVSVPAVFAGTWIGDRLLQRVDATLFRRLVLFLLVATALVGVATSVERLVV